MVSKLGMAIFLVVFCVHHTAFAAGFATNDNFIVLSPPVPSQAAGQRFAEKIAKQANELRQSIAEEWLGNALPDGVGRTVINVQFSKEPDSALTWAKDSAKRKFHNIYIKTPQSEKVAMGLAHEIAHAVLATEFPHPNRLPAWVEEAIACRYDEKARIKKRTDVLAWFVRTKNLPKIEPILKAENISPVDAESYTVSCSLSDFLLTLGDKATFIEFARQIQNAGIAASLQQVYGIASVDDLETRWKKWLLTERKQPNQVASRRLASVHARPNAPAALLK